MLCMRSSAVCMHAWMLCQQQDRGHLALPRDDCCTTYFKPSGRHMDHADSDEPDEHPQTLCDDGFVKTCTHRLPILQGSKSRSWFSEERPSSIWR